MKKLVAVMTVGVCLAVAQSSSSLSGAVSDPSGAGASAMVGPRQGLTYAISLVNSGTTTVRNLAITLQLDPSLDWSSFGFGNIAFGVSSSVSVQAGLQSFNATVHTNNSDGSPLGLK